MKASRFSEEQIIGVIKEQQVGEADCRCGVWIKVATWENSRV
ncbi:MAG: hypothetical protein JWR51_4505 [Devosia sp.]|nr:hypothetical protein [Devosia sp.]